MSKKIEHTDTAGKQPVDQIAQAKTDFMGAGSKLPYSVNGKDITSGNKQKFVAKKKEINEDDIDLTSDTGAESAADFIAQAESAADPIILAQAGSSTATDAAAAGSASSAAGASGAEAGAAAGSGAAAGAAAGAAMSVGTMALIGAGIIGVAAAAGGGGSAAVASATGFTLSGTIALGKINDNTGLIIEAFKADGTQLLTSSSVVNANGTFTITVTENYTGSVLIRLKDTNPGTNYTDEGTGAAADLTTDLRVMVNVSGSGGSNIAVMLTPLTELAVRELVGDSGGDGGTSGAVLGATVTTTQVTAANDGIKAAFGLTSDIVTTTPATVDDAAGFAAATAAQQAYGQVLAAIAGAEANLGTSTGTVLNTLAQGVSGSTVDQAVIDLLIAGATTADGVAGNATGAATALTTVIGSNISAIDISADTGSATDFITQTAAQTITATLDAALTGTKLWGSVDGGTTWTDISGFVTTTSLSWTGVTLAGNSSIKLAVTANTVTAFTGAAADVVGNVSVQSYSVDAAAPAFTSLTTANFAENGTGTAYTTAATDAHLLTYTKTGADAALFNLDSNSGVVTFLTAPNFEAPADAGGDNVYNISVTATDGAGNASLQAVAITVTDANEMPSLTSGAAASFAENATGTVYTAAATDPDAGATLTYALAGTDAARFAINATSGAVTFATSPNFESPTDAGGNNVYDITVTASDGTNTTAAQAVAITVTNANEMPSLTSGAAANFAENATGTVYTATATDPDAGAALTYALAGTDAALFAINATSGAVTFAAPPNFETPADAGGDNVYNITVAASDGTNTTTPQAVAVTVTNVNETPTSTTVTATAAAVNQAYSFNASGNFSDVDAGNVFSYGATGLPTGLSIGATTGIISGTATATGTSSVTVTATDSGSLTTSQTFNLSVVSAPVISSISANVTQAQNGDALTFTVGITEPVTVVTTGGVPTLTLDVGGTTMIATYSGGTTTNTLTFTATTPATGDDATVTVTAINLNSGTITGITTSQALVTTSVGQAVSSFVVDNTNPAFTSATAANFAENATGTAYASAVTDATTLTYTKTGADAALFAIDAGTGAVTFNTSPNFETPTDAGGDNVYNIPVPATDALGHATNQAVAITVTNANEMPSLTSGAAASFAENATGTVYAAAATDPDAGATLTYALAGTDAARFAINATSGAVTFATSPNFEAALDSGANNVYDITVTASDGTNTTAAQAVAITVTNVNEMPSLTSGAAASFAENATGTVYAAAATDPDAGTTLTYALAGTDAGLFNINSSTGVVTFAATPNFEVPTDAGGDHVCNITVTASDGTNTTAPQAVAITVTDVNEAPTLTSGTTSSATFVVNQAFSSDASLLFSDVDAGNVFSYGATGLPTGVSINPSTGVISGTATATATGVSVVITATDSGGLPASHTITVNVVSAPTLTSTIDNVANFDVTSNIVLTASSAVTKGTGFIRIVNDANDVNKAGFHGETTANTQTIDVTSGAVSITNNTITINPGFDLDLANNYHIEVDAGAFMSGGGGSVAVTGATAMNFSTVTPNDGLFGVASAITNATSQAMDATGTLVASYSWMDIEGVGAPSSANGTVRDLSTGNIAMVFKDYDTTTVAGGAQDGIGAPDLYVSATNFGAGDLLYVDNQLNTQPNDLAIASFFNDTPSNGVTQISFGTGVGGLGGLVEVTPVGAPTPSFVTALELQTLLSTTYIPIVSA